MATLVLPLLTLAAAVNAVRPRRGGGPAMIASFFAAWLFTEWAWVAAAANAVHAGVVLWRGELLTAAVATLAAIAAAYLVAEVARDGAAWRDFARDAALGSPRSRPAWWRVVLPFPPRRLGVEVVRDVAFARRGNVELTLDIYRRRGASPGPCIVQVHGGAWIIGDKREQGLPLLYELAARGWVGFNINYRLCPRATFPEPLDDVRDAIRWVRANAASFGGDGDFVAVTGGSAGAHLAALATLAAVRDGDDRSRVDAAALMYGVYDLTDRRSIMTPRFVHGLLRKHVFKASIRDAPDRYAAASPIDAVVPGGPPTLVVHGARDVLAPPEYAKDFGDALVAAGCEAHGVSLPGAQHAFDVFYSPRTVLAVGWIAEFLDAARERAARGDVSAPEAGSTAA
ncbi:MAG: alpha/beta hydrolase [Myxococcales bacterium]|nr:alpha/beta hydrolase [Myxococcales bacterium]MCB9521038.1 alpha/beta hydrolase [Myxococcales bacterium]